MDLKKTECRWCGLDTPYLHTKECDRCHNTRTAIESNPLAVLKILEASCGEPAIRAKIEKVSRDIASGLILEAVRACFPPDEEKARAEELAKAVDHLLGSALVKTETDSKGFSSWDGKTWSIDRHVWSRLQLAAIKYGTAKKEISKP